MAASRSGRRVGLILGVAVVAAFTQTPTVAARLASAAAPAQPTGGNASSIAKAIGFGPTTVVDDQRAAGEPDVKVCGPSATWSYGNCGLGNPYASAPYGFSTTSSFVWRSEDQGRTFKLVPSNVVTGKPDVCPGGGDTDLSVSPAKRQANDFLSFIDLQALNNFSSGTSANGGQSFTCDPASTLATAVDRQWFGVYRDPAGAPANGSVVYLDYDIANGSVACATDPTANGNLFVVQKSTDGGLTYGPATVADCNDGIAGNMQVNQATGEVYAIHTAYSSPTNTTTDQVSVDRSTDSGATFTPAKVFSCGGTCVVGQDFAVLAIDKSGHLYSVWSQAPVDSSGAITGPGHIFMSYSADGITWSPETQVDHGTTDVNLFPWIAAGNNGAVDVVWYGTTKSPSAPNYDSGSQTSDWFPYLSQSLNANSATPTFSAPVQVAQHSNHNGAICTMGIGCTTGGDRSLADFFQVDITKTGAADVIWADTSNNGNNNANSNGSPGALIVEAQQVSGHTLFGTTLSGSLSQCRAVRSTPCQSDPVGDARYEANGTIGANTPKLDISGSSINIDPANHSLLDVRLKVANLSSLPVTADVQGGPFVDYLTTWNYHVPGSGQAQYDSTGNIYYAYLEVNTATGGVTAYDGNTCSLATDHPKYLVYPGQNPITGTIQKTSGTIDLYVPLSDVGAPPIGATLYSVTAHTVTQPAAAGPDVCSTRDATGNNQDPAGQLFNVYDKSAAYTAVLALPH